MKIDKNRMKSIIVFLIFINLDVYSQKVHIWKKVFDFNNVYIGRIIDAEIIDSLNSIVLVSESTNLIKYKIKKSTDRGKSWEEINSNFQFEPQCLSSPKINTIYIGGPSRNLLITKNNGLDWENKKLKVGKISDGYSVFLISMYNENEGIALLTQDVFYGLTELYSTNDGWKTYEKVKPPNGFSFVNPLAFRKPYIKCISKGVYFTNVIEKSDTMQKEQLALSRNSGESWQIISKSSIFKEPSDSIRGNSFDFIDSVNGYAFGDLNVNNDSMPWGILSKTTNGGQTWDKKNVFTLPYIVINPIKGAVYNGGISVKNDTTGIIAMPFASRFYNNENKLRIDSVELESWFSRLFVKSRGKIESYLAYTSFEKVDNLLADFGEYTPSNIIEYGIAINVSITPNPAHNEATIQIEKDKGEGNVSLYNILGEQVKRKDFLNESPISLDLSG
ncbi:MAG: hypothetical protein WAT89_00985, partial [Candidatus Kapaibacterium sp.]